MLHLQVQANLEHLEARDSDVKVEMEMCYSSVFCGTPFHLEKSPKTTVVR
jgi:hypothetical protein